jgi:hypothetical protein
MRLFFASLLAVFLAIALAACGEEEQGGQARTSTQAAPARVPAGVAAQYRTIEEEVGAEGGESTRGPWRIAYIVEPAEPWFAGRRFREAAADETHHIEILPIESKTGRVVPNVPVSLEVLDPSGEVVDRKKLDFFYAEFFHYAQNFSIPRNGRYTLRATLEPPTFLRHGEENETPALSEGATVEFDDVLLEREAGA